MNYPAYHTQGNGPCIIDMTVELPAPKHLVKFCGGNRGSLVDYVEKAKEYRGELVDYVEEAGKCYPPNSTVFVWLWRYFRDAAARILPQERERRRPTSAPCDGGYD
jgi:hypothetical protein